MKTAATLFRAERCLCQPQSLALTAPLISIWDDHEFTNNAWADGAENQNDTLGGSAALRRLPLTCAESWQGRPAAALAKRPAVTP
jgi:hypothetical protein